MEPTLRTSYIISLTTIVAVTVGASVYFRLRLQTSWRWFGFGAVVFLLSQLVRVLVLATLINFLGGRVPGWAIICAVTAGIFEEVGRYLGYKYLVPQARSWESGFFYGLGHGALEAMLTAGLMGVAMYTFLAYGRLDISVVKFGPQEFADILEAQTWWFPLAGVLQRVAALPIHIALSLVVMRSILSGNYTWVCLAVVLHSGINIIVGLTFEHFGVLQSEVVALVFAGLASCAIFRMRSVLTCETKRGRVSHTGGF